MAHNPPSVSGAFNSIQGLRFFVSSLNLTSTLLPPYPAAAQSGIELRDDTRTRSHNALHPTKKKELLNQPAPRLLPKSEKFSVL